MRRSTRLVLLALLAAIVVTAIVQFTLASRESSFPGPTVPGQLPSPAQGG